MTAGIAFKIAAVPFHAWAPDAYQGASAPVAAFLAAGSKAAGLAALGRVTLVAFGSQAEVLAVFLAGLAALSLIVGSIVLLSQTDMKRLLAYSSISHAGYALLGLIGGTAEGTSATMTYAFFYVFMTLGTFGVVIALGERGEKLDGYHGLASQRPAIAALMLLFLLSLTGNPPNGRVRGQVRRDPERGARRLYGAGSPRRGLQCGVGVHLHAGGRPDVHAGTAGTGAVTLPCGDFRGTRTGRTGHSGRRDQPRHLRGLGDIAVILKMMYTVSEVTPY